MMADRRRVGALALTQCAAFAAVLILAAFSGPRHSPTPPGQSPSPATSSSRATSPSQVTSSPPTSSDVAFTVTASAAPPQTATPTATSKATATFKATATPKATEPTPTATGTPSPRSFQNTPVVTLDARTLKPVASDRLNSTDSAIEVVPANQVYLVCLSPPQGWKSAVGSTYRLPGWICVRQPVATTGETVSFELEPASSSGAGGTG